MAYNFDKIIDSRNTRSAKWDSYPEEYLPLPVAVTDFPSSDAIVKALVTRAEHPEYGYPRPGEALLDAFLKHFEYRYGVALEKDWINLISGIVPGLAVGSNLGEGITNVPNYGGLLNAPVRAGNALIHVPLQNVNEEYHIDFDALQAALTPKTKLFYLCNPHNPIGKVYTQEELQQISAFAKKNNLIVLSDEIHCDLVLEGKHIPFFTVDDYAREHSITFHAPGKTFNIPGVTLAFAIIPNEELKKDYLKEAYALRVGGVFNITAGIAAYQDSEDYIDAIVPYLRSNRDFVEEQLRTRFPKAKFTHTQATYLQWVDFRAYGEDLDAEFFKEHAKLVFTGGDFFGAPGYVRINFGTNKKILGEAFDRIENAIKHRLSS